MTKRSLSEAPSAKNSTQPITTANEVQRGETALAKLEESHSLHQEPGRVRGDRSYAH